MDFIVELPESQGFDAIYVCVDWLTKIAHFSPTNSNVTAEQTADLYVRNVFKIHSLPDDIVSDRGTKFVSKFSRRLLELLDVKGNRSTAYHPESDGKRERVNQTLEQYLRIYCDFHQDDWSQLLPLAEFTYNNAKKHFDPDVPFFANFGYHPRASLKVSRHGRLDSKTRSSARLERLEARRAQRFRFRVELRAYLQNCQSSKVEPSLDDPHRARAEPGLSSARLGSKKARKLVVTLI
jgi:hypothetical protein